MSRKPVLLGATCPAAAVFAFGAVIGALALDNLRLREERDALQTVVDYVSGGLSVDGFGVMPEDEEPE